VEKPDRMTPLGLPRRRWKNNIKMELRQMESEGMDWIYLARDRDMWRVIVSEVTKISVP